MSALRRAYGSGPFHLVTMATCFVISGYAIARLAGSSEPVLITAWFVAALLGHDFLLFPVYTLLDRAVARRQGPGSRMSPPRVNFVRVPVLLTGLVFLVSFPLILGLNDRTYRDASGLGTGRFLGRFLLFSAVVFAASALLYGLRVLRSRRRSD